MHWALCHYRGNIKNKMGDEYRLKSYHKGRSTDKQPDARPAPPGIAFQFLNRHFSGKIYTIDDSSQTLFAVCF